MTENVHNNICRSCLELISSRKYPLKGQVINADLEIVSMLEFCTSSKMDLSVDLPNSVCVSCYKTIRIAYLFLKQFYEAQVKLIQSRNKQFVKVEEVPKKKFEHSPKVNETSIQDLNNYAEQSSNKESSEKDSIPDNIKVIDEGTNHIKSDSISNHEENNEIKYEEVDEVHTPEEVHEYFEDIDRDEDNKDTEFLTYKTQEKEIDESFLEIQVADVPDEECENIQFINDESQDFVHFLNLGGTDLDQSNIEVVVDDDPSKKEKDERVYRYICPMCGKKFWKVEPFYSHIINYNLSKIKCNRCKCDPEFAVEEYFQHYIDHHKFQCHICDKVMSSSYGYIYHMKHHENARKFKCPIEGCCRSFLMNHLLKKHIKSHTMESVYSCHICDASFRTNDSLRYHLKLHYGKKDHLCTICGQAFYQAVHLRDHMYRHYGYKSFVCEICGKGFVTKGSLKKHIQYCSRRHNVNVMDTT